MFPSRCHQCRARRSTSFAFTCTHSVVAALWYRCGCWNASRLRTHTGLRTHTHTHAHPSIHTTDTGYGESRVMPNVASFLVLLSYSTLISYVCVRCFVLCVCVCIGDPSAGRKRKWVRTSESVCALVFVAETKFIAASLFNEKQHTRKKK